MANEKEDFETVKVRKLGQTGPDIQESGKTIKLMDMGLSGTWMEMFMKAIEEMIKLMDMEFIARKMELDIKEIG